MEGIDTKVLTDEGCILYMRWMRAAASDFTAAGFVVSREAHDALRRARSPAGSAKGNRGLTLCGLPVIASDIVPDGEIRLIVE